jgi:hypothetical protein
MNKSTKFFLATSIAFATLIGCGGSSAGSNNKSEAIKGGSSKLSRLTNEQKYSLAYMWNEERLAKDIYLALNDLYPAKQLENIATKSEQRHIDAVEELVAKYDININNLVDYTIEYSEAELRAMPAGTYGVETVQQLYNDLYAKGKLSKIDALQVGCMVEVTDVNDLDKFIETAKTVNATDLVSVFDNLRSGSYNHYWAFDSALKAEGVSDGCASLGGEYAKTEQEYPSEHGGNGNKGQGNGRHGGNTKSGRRSQSGNHGQWQTQEQWQRKRGNGKRNNRV